MADKYELDPALPGNLQAVAHMAAVSGLHIDDLRVMPAAGVADILYEALFEIQHHRGIEELEAKLAKAVEALGDLADCVDDGCFCSEMRLATTMDQARATLAELKGRNDG
jgi:hypothetical protein